MHYQSVPLHELNFTKQISKDDWMYKSTTNHGYFLRGYEALSLVHQAIKQTRVSAQEILDFGCGHGCVARMVKAQYPRARIHGQDVNPDWLSWCREHLGIETIQSPERIADVEIPPERYDVIWVGSVFTHIPERNFDHLLSQLVQGLKPRGLLIFTTAGHPVRISFTPGKEKLISQEGAKAALQDYDASGYGFTPYVGGRYVDWGRTLSSFDKVHEKIRQTPARLLSFQEGGWGRRQDVYTLLRET